jgi:hypothetical protein
LNPRELKQILVSEGLQVFRVLGSQVVLADRVRENLIMDSGVAVICGETQDEHRVRVVVRAQAADYPDEGEQQLFFRAREAGAAPQGAGYLEIQTAVVPVADPGDSARTLDTWYEVTYEKPNLALAALMPELRSALEFRKIA